MTLFVSDLDGTLLNNSAEVSPESAILLNKSIENGINFTIATARTPATIVNILKDINIKLPIITMNGSAIYDIKNDKYLNFTSLPKEKGLEVYQIIKSFNINAFVYTINNNHLYVYYDKLTHPYQLEFYNSRKATKYKTFIQGELNPNFDVLYFTIMDYEDKISILYEKLKLLSDLYIVKYRDTYNKDIVNLEIYDIKSSKANAINMIKDRYSFENLITFGDNLNDIPMFNISDKCYAVENAVQDLKDISTEIIGKNTDNSIAKFIYECI